MTMIGISHTVAITNTFSHLSSQVQCDDTMSSHRSHVCVNACVTPTHCVHIAVCLTSTKESARGTIRKVVII